VRRRSALKQPTAAARHRFLEAPPVLARGRAKVYVVENGNVVKESPWINNLILDSGLDRLATERWRDQLTYAVCGTGTEVTKEDVTGTYSQAGTTVTRASGARDFTINDEGRLIRWDSGEEAKVVTFTSATTVTVDRSQTVVADDVIIYRVDQIGMGTETQRSNTYAVYTDPDLVTLSCDNIADSGTATVLFRRTFDFPEEVGDVTYTEIGFSSQAGAGNNLWSRIFLVPDQEVLTGQQLRVRYELYVKCGSALGADHVTEPFDITGWPVEYGILSVTSDGTEWVVTTDGNHHYLAGGSITINGTVDYDGDYVIDSVTADTITISDATNLTDAGAVGTVYNNTVATFKLLWWNIANFSTGTAGYNATYNNLSVTGAQDYATIMEPSRKGTAGTARFFNLCLYADVTPGSFPVAGGENHAGRTSTSNAALAPASYTAGNHYLDYEAVFTSSVGNADDIQGIGISVWEDATTSNHITGTSRIQGFWDFEQPQVKDELHRLTVPIRFSWGRDLTVEQD
jgi:hypothetical protein